MGKNGEPTPVQKRMLKLFSDGMYHTKEELRGCLFDEQGAPNNVHYHLMKIREYLAPKGQTINCIYRSRKIMYCHVINLPPYEYDG